MFVDKEMTHAPRTKEAKALQIAKTALEFYSGAKTLFLTRDGSWPKIKNTSRGFPAGYEEESWLAETHFKDDGDKAREALKTINEILKEEKK